jgi:murein tripeptide amidase MpaA
MIRALTLFSVLIPFIALAQQEEILPPVPPWKGKSLNLIVKKDNPWITPTEKSDFVTTPSYAETVAWFKRLCDASPMLHMATVGQSANGRKIEMIIASLDNAVDASSLRASDKPLLLIHAGIHAGEIDGNTAGMMLLRDIAFGKKRELLSNVNLLFIPILNVDGHERVSPYNRPNQRGPANMGWRTNARNLNLNRDYSKLDAEEVQTVVKVMNEYGPSFYVDLHVTDGADYQYDITYGHVEYSPSINEWLVTIFSPAIDKSLKENGHIPGPLVFAANDRDFTKGKTDFGYMPRFSTNYGDIRRIPSILVENHSLKPFKQRVLGTYVFLEALLKVTAKESLTLKKAIQSDAALRNENVVLTWKAADKPDMVEFLGIESVIEKSVVTTSDYVKWTGKAITQNIPYQRINQPAISVKRPKAYWVPATYQNVIERLAMHGIEMEKITESTRVTVELYRLKNHKYSAEPFEGHFTVAADVHAEKHEETFYPGSVRIATDQVLGDLVMYLLEPQSPDSFLSWGFFNEIFTRTEYIEEYAIEPLARWMLARDENLRKEFELKKQQEPGFADDKTKVYSWFYERSQFYDSRYLLYPVGIER